jgi:hypothetical protein
MEIEWFNYVEELKKNNLELTGPLFKSSKHGKMKNLSTKE